ncbi:hypothetical protein ACOKM3_14325 [Streptomyces sp. BH106]|uniref:hypothetical protein n=1 Tax=Streptomyces sp. BH106 TaxID=3410409 RepID=UPI003CF06B91
MRKRASKPARFEMVDREAIRDIPSILSTGVLNHLIAARDGDDVTVAGLVSRYAEGERVLEKAMRVLVDDGRVVKFKIQHAQTATVYDRKTGKETSKRGGSWRTEFSVDAHGSRFTREDVAAMYDEILTEGNVRAVRIEPEYLDPRKNGLRPTPQKCGVGPTSNDAANPHVGPEPRFAGAGRPGAGNRGALNRKETVSRDSSLPGSTDDPAAEALAQTEEEEAAATTTTEPNTEVAAFVAVLPGAIRLTRGQRDKLAALATARLAEGWTTAQLAEVCAWRTSEGPQAPYAVYSARLADLPAPPATPAPRRKCVNHPRAAAEIGDLCVTCHTEKQAATDSVDVDHDLIAAFRKQRRNRVRVGA